MGFLESIGGLALIAAGIYALISYTSSQEDKKRLESKLIENNYSCTNLIHRYNQSVDKGKPIMTRSELKKEIENIIRDPKERQQAINRINDKIESKQRIDQDMKDKRKFGFRYENEIFEIFDTNRELSNKDLIPKIELRFNLEQESALNLIKEWNENLLIEKCPWTRNYWQIGSILKYDFYSLDSNDLTRDKWLKNNSKTLKERSFKEKQYLEKIDLPF